MFKKYQFLLFSLFPFIAVQTNAAFQELNSPLDAEIRQTSCLYTPKRAPEMVLLPGGKIELTSTEFSNVAAQVEPPPNSAQATGGENLKVVQAFAISKCEVLTEEYNLFKQETGRKLQIDQIPQNCLYNTEVNAAPPSLGQEGNSGVIVRYDAGYFYTAEDSMVTPITCVSWEDASDYAAWLSEKTGFNYRLPTNDEWLYAFQLQQGIIKRPDSVTQDLPGLDGMDDNALEWTDGCEEQWTRVSRAINGESGCTNKTIRTGRNQTTPFSSWVDRGRAQKGVGFRLVRDLE